MDIQREPKTVVVEALDLWALQKTIKFNTFMLDPRNMRPVFPETADRTAGGVVPVHTAWKLRRKVNNLLLRFAQEPGLTKALLPLDYDECWYIDNVLGVEAYKSAGELLLQVFQCLWEWENSLSLKTGQMNENMAGPDGKFDLNAVVEYLSQKGVDRGGWFPKNGEPPPEAV